uniref:BTB domain-containing protein n=1 Tax=Clytia hemisphaerica TaxID=252671 RepID=A0A7M5WQC2_9CNID
MNVLINQIIGITLFPSAILFRKIYHNKQKMTTKKKVNLDDMVDDWDSYIMIETSKDGTVCTTSGLPTPKSCNKMLVLELNHELASEVLYARGHNIPCDVYLKCDDGTIFSAHKNVLSVTSLYFNAMFQTNMIEKSQAIIDIRCVTSEALKYLIDFAYSSTLYVSFYQIYDLLMASNMLCVEQVEHQCVAFLGQNLDIENCIEIWSLAEMINCEPLYNASFNFVQNNFRRVSQELDFLQLSFQQMELILSNDYIDVSSESDVFEAIINWVSYDSMARLPCLARLLQYVRFMLLSRKYLADRVLRENLVMSDENSRNIVLQILDRYILPERTCSLNTNQSSTSPRQASNRKIYVIGGKASGKCKSSMECYNFKTNSWRTLSRMKYPRYNAVAVTLDGNLYVLGGYYRGKDLKVVERYNPITDEWRVVSSLRKCKGALSAVSIDGWIYAVGGSEGHQESLRHAEQYDPVCDTWTQLPDMLTPRSHFGIGQMFGQLHVIGGFSGICALDQCECFDPSQREWRRFNSLNTSRMNHSITTFNNRFYAFGGKNSTGLVHSVEKYNPELNMWLIIKTNLDVKLGMVCVGRSNGTGNSVFIIGGKKENGEESNSSTVLTFKPIGSDLNNEQIVPMKEKRTYSAIAYL